MPAKKQKETTANIGKRTAQVGSTTLHLGLVEFLFLNFNSLTNTSCLLLSFLVLSCFSNARA